MRPCLIVEVLSEAIERIDRSEELLVYTGIYTLQSYILLSQEVRVAELHRRAEGWRGDS